MWERFFVDPFAASECVLLFLEVGFGLFLCGECFGVFFSGVVAVAGDPFGFAGGCGAFADGHWCLLGVAVLWV